MFGSREAANAIYACRELEYTQYTLRKDLEELSREPSKESCQEDVRLGQQAVADLQREYAAELRAVKAAFPRVVCCAAFETGGCEHGKLCECGWMQAPWPWIVHRHGERFCDCHVESRWRHG